MGKTKPSAEYLAELRRRYRHSRRSARSIILDEFVKTTGYHRKHAIALLKGTYRPHTGPIRRPRARRYTQEDRRAVLRLAELFDQINSKRLRSAMNATLDQLQAQGFLRVSAASLRRLKKISPATMDRIRAEARAKAGQARPHGLALTKPGSLLKSQIPVRTFADWDDVRPGFTECDLVEHCGGDPSGDFAQTLTVTDIATGWTEAYAVRNKAQKHVFSGLETIRGRLPFALLGIDSDNGSEFINDHLFRYCQREQITFTRSRAGRKNDNAHVEQKNWSVVRRLVGYGRYDTPRQVSLLNRLYQVDRLYVNFFLPVMKLEKKVREGSKVKRIYDEPQTPYARVLASPDVSNKAKAKLRKLYATLDVVELKREIDELSVFLGPTPWRSPARDADEDGLEG